MEQVQQSFETDVNEGLESPCWTAERKGGKKNYFLDYKSACEDFLKQQHSTLTDSQNELGQKDLLRSSGPA